MVAERLREANGRVAGRFAELHGTGRAITDPAKIESAAAQGRVETLFLASEPSCWEQTTSTSPTVLELGANEVFAHCELLDRAAVDTLTNDGQIFALSETMVPGGEDIAAVLRY